MGRMVGSAAGLVALLAAAAVLVVLAVLAALAQAQCGDGTPTANVTAPAQTVATMGQDVRYLQSEGIDAVAAAGIAGNLMQESGLNPAEPGGGLAQWKAGWWSSASAWIRAHGQDPNTVGGQLMYIAANVLDDLDGRFFFSGLRAELQRATSTSQAALVWMDDYEQCQGAGPPGTTIFKPNSPCMAPQRERYAQQALQAAGGTTADSATLASLTTDGACNAIYPLTGNIAGYTNPFERARGWCGNAPTRASTRA